MARSRLKIAVLADTVLNGGQNAYLLKVNCALSPIFDLSRQRALILSRLLLKLNQHRLGICSGQNVLRLIEF